MMVALFEFDNYIIATNHSCHAVNGHMWGVAAGTVTLDICGPFLRADGRASTVRDLIVAASTQDDVKRILVEEA